MSARSGSVVPVVVKAVQTAQVLFGEDGMARTLRDAAVTKVYARAGSIAVPGGPAPAGDGLLAERD